MKCFMKVESFNSSRDGGIVAMFNTVAPDGDRDFKGFLKMPITLEEMNALGFEAIVEVKLMPIEKVGPHD